MRSVHTGFRGAGISLMYLGGSLAMTFPAMLLLSTLAPDFTERLGRVLFFGMMALLCAAGGSLWGAHLGRIAQARQRRSWAIAGALGYGVSAPLATLGLTEAETFLLNQVIQGAIYPMHVAFAVIFGSAFLVVVGVTALAVGLASGHGWRALHLAALSSGVAVASFLAVDLGFDLMGWRVGAPGAEERFTMLVVLGVGMLFATSAGGAVLARALAPALATEREPVDLRKFRRPATLPS